MNRIRERMRLTYLESAQALVAAVEAKDPFTRAHSQAVAHYAEAIRGRLVRREAPRQVLATAAILHDVGKIGVPDAILTKPGPLTPKEFEIVKKHPQMGVDILCHVSQLRDELPMILHHHERFDGTGYPHGLVGTKIPWGARILGVADALDAMLSQRYYKPPFNLARVRAELARGAGRQFDPEMTAATIDWLAGIRSREELISSVSSPRSETGPDEALVVIPDHEVIKRRNTNGRIPPWR